MYRSWAHVHRAAKLLVPCPTQRERRSRTALTHVATLSQRRAIRSRAGFDEMFDAITEGSDKNPTFAPLDSESTGGLGGTSEDVFGPLVIIHQQQTSQAVIMSTTCCSYFQDHT
jgi:hypothetical protein